MGITLVRLNQALPGIAQRVRILLFPHAGGSAFGYAGWAAHVPAHILLECIEFSGRVHDNGLALSGWDAYRLACRNLFLNMPEMPTAMIGHSMGALSAFEGSLIMAELFPGSLRALCVTGCRAPILPGEQARPCLSGLNDDDLLDVLFNLGGASAEQSNDDEYISNYLPIIRRDFALLESHLARPGQKIHQPILAFGGSADEGVPQAALAQWAQFTSAGFQLNMLPGGHFFNLCYTKTILNGAIHFLE